MAADLQDRDLPVATSEAFETLDVRKLSDFVCGVAAFLLDMPSEEAAQVLGQEENRALVQAFAEDKDVPVLLLVAWNERPSSGARLGLFGGIPGNWRDGDDTALGVTILKTAPTLNASQPLAHQVQILSLGATPMVDALHTYVHRSFKPLLDGHFSASVPGQDASSTRRDVTGPTLVRKKVAELELALRGCQDEVKVADVVLHEHFPHAIIELTDTLAKRSSQQDREEVKEAFLQECKGSKQLKQALLSALNACHKDLSDLAARFDRRMVSSADMTPASERDFWLRMQEVMSKVEEQTRLPHVEYTLEMVKRLKVQQHIPRQLEEDVASLKTKLDSAQKYNILLRELPVDDVRTAPDLGSTGVAVVKVLEHLRKHLIRSAYPIARATQLLEAVSRQLLVHMIDLLRKKNLMDMRYEEFQRLCGYSVGGVGDRAGGTREAAAADRRTEARALGRRGVEGVAGAEVGTCRYVFDAWNEKERELVNDMSRFRKFHKDGGVDLDGNRATTTPPPHLDLSDRIQQIVGFRYDHQSLCSVMTKVTKSSSKVGGYRGRVGGEGLSIERVEVVEAQALQVLSDAYHLVLAVDVLDMSKEGADAWAAALQNYNDRVDRVETQMTTNLRNSLAAARDAKDMLSIFSIFSPLLVRPKIRLAIQEYQNKLLVQVKDDVKALQERFTRQYANSQASCVMATREVPPLAGSIIWARQLERQLRAYMQRVQHVLGQGWEDHPEGQKLKAEGDAFGDKLDAAARVRKWQEDVLQANKETMTLFNLDAFTTNLFRIVTTRRKQLVLEVNFDQGQAELCNEARSLSLLGFKLIPSIETFANTLQRIYPFAMSMSEAIRLYFHASARIDPTLEPLLASAKSKMHCYLKLGLDHKLAAAWKVKDLQRELKRDFERHPRFLDEFVRKREFEHLELYSRKLYDCALAFQGKVADMLAKMKAVEAALVNLQKCALEKEALHRIVDALQGIVSEMELSSYSNLAWWVKQLDKRIDVILLARLEELVRIWMQCFRPEMASSPSAFGPADADIAEHQPTEYFLHWSQAARSRLEIKIKNSVLFVDPPVENARAAWVNHLSASMEIITEMPRIRHSAYSEFSDMYYETKKSTYQALVYKLPASVMQQVYRMIDEHTTSCERYIGSWLNYQALWDLDSSTVIAKIGHDLSEWLAVVTELRASRLLFETEETFMTFGAITVDFARVQSGVVAKFDAWHKEMMLAFAALLQDRIRKMLLDLKNARESLEHFSADKGTSDAVEFLNGMQVFKTDKISWETDVKSLREGERTLQKHRFKFANDWTYVEMIEGEWMAFVQIYSKKEIELADKLSSLQAKVFEWDKSVSERINIAVNEWSVNKPIQGNIPPADALDQLSIFQTSVKKLQQDHLDIVQAKEALGMEILSGIKLSAIVAEMADLREVWLSLVQPHSAVLALGDTAWNAVIPRKVRSSLEEIQASLRSLPNMIRQYAACEHISTTVTAYLKSNAFIIDLRSQAMKERHWDILGNRLNMRFNPSEMTLRDVWSANIHLHESLFKDVLSKAQGEFGLEEYLKQLRESWQIYQLDLVSYQHKVSLIRGWDDLFTQLNENLNSLSSMRTSPYFMPFKDEASKWEGKLNTIRDTFTLWAEIQRRWVYLEGIFLHSCDIKNQLPLEHSHFMAIDNDFVSLMRQVAKKPSIMDVVDIKDVQTILSRLDELLCRIQKSLADYLEGKRSSFPRFYFVGDDDLLEIIGSGKEPAVIQRHFRKMFSGIQSFVIEEEGSNLTAMQSAQGEVVPFRLKVSFAGAVEVNAWLSRAEEQMRLSLSADTEAGVSSVVALTASDFSSDQLFGWIDSCSLQVAVVAVQILACQKIEADILASGHAFVGSSDFCKSWLRMLADAVLKDLSAIRRKKAEHCIGELVHQQNMIQILVHKNTLDLGDFSWLYFLRVYYRASEKSELERLQVLVADASFLYGFEYQGVADRLVQTPLTDRAFLVLTQALRSRMGGSPFGPAGTGKTETVKALAGQLGRFVLVFNCDETFDLQSMGRIFLGLCQTGAWGCFDEFNRLEERILSAVSQQILIIQTAVRRNYAQVELIGRSLTLNPNIGIFITMNPGYIGRSNLPDNLKQLFRSVAMTKPDSEMIAEIMLYSQGFQDAAMLSRKIVPLFKLCAEQLSPCSHYDFGLRALKSVLVGSGQLKRTAIATAAATAVGQAQEISIIVKSFCGAVIPKLLPDDVVLLQSLLRDVFPGAQEPDFSDDAICEAIVGVCRDWKFQLSDLWLKKVMQLSQIVNLNHGVMLVGPSGSGKSAACRVLFEALRRIDIESEKKPGSCFHQLDPKALSKSALYGTLDPTTREWTDGVLTKILREIVDGHRGDKDGRHWIVLDGDVDPEWIENLNSVLDDNRLLTLPTGERIVVPGNVRIIFEVQDLQFATLATVSRCGMVWFSQDTVTHSLLLSRYLSCLVSAVAFSSWDFSRKTNLDPSVAGTCAKVFEALLDRNGLLEKALVYVAAYDHVMAFSMQQALNALFSLLSEGVARAQDYHLDRPGGPLAHNVIEKFISKHTLVCIVCSLGGSLDLQHRELFAKWIGGITTIAVPSSDRSLLHYEVNVSDGEWLALDSKVPSIDIETNRIVASDVLITTIDTVRHEQLLKSWLKNRQPVLLCGPPGSGKTMTITACLRAMPDAELVSLNFSSTSSPDLLMITFEHYCTYSKSANGGTVLRPNMGGKWLVIFCDEVNLPAPDKYGTQHVIAMLRQCIEHGGFWRASDLSWVKLERIQFVAACNPPTDAGRTVLTPRFLRHTPLLYVDFPGKESLQQIYGTLSKALLKLAPALSPYAQPLTDALVDYYTLCKDHFNRDMQPHYIYSPRELSRWMRAMYEAMRSKDMVTPEFLVQLVMHEGLRLFQDRLVDEDERSWADSTINSVICKYFPTIDHQGCLVRPLLLCNWLTREYAQVQQTALRDFVKARLRVFYEEELNVPLVVFDQVLDHVLRIDRVLRQPLGHVLLIGASGSGKTVLSRFVAWHNGYSVFQIKAHRGYGQTDFEADLRKVMKRSGCKGETVCFIFDESNILSSGFLELMNALLASGEVPGLFDGEEWPVLMQQCKEAAQRDGVMVDSEDQLYKRFIQQVQANLHIVFTMNPASSDYSNRTATSPALFNRCVVNWVGDWSGDALRQVAHEFTASLDLEIGCEPSAQGEADLRDSVVGALVFVHKAVQRVCERRIKHHDELLFVTPRHYVDFIQQFVRIFEEKRSEIEEQQLHLNVGLRRLTETQEAVQELGVSLEAKEKELAAKEVEANDKLQQMVHDQQEAEKQKAVTAQLKVKVEASQKEILDRQAQVHQELADVEPLVQQAKDAVQGIKKAQLDEVRSMLNPPGGVKMTMEAVCIMLYEVKKPSWDEIRKNIRKDDFVSGILNLDTEALKKDKAKMKALSTFISDPDFAFENINKSSKACGPLVQWAIAQYKFATILGSIDPLRQEVYQLQEAGRASEEQLALLTTQGLELEAKLDEYKREYAMLISDTQAIKNEMAIVKYKVQRSTTLLQSLLGERERWQQQTSTFGDSLSTLVGNVVLSSAFLVYLGMFDQETRASLRQHICASLVDAKIPFDEALDYAEYLSQADERLLWHANALPEDALCVENAVMIKRFNRYPLVIDPSGQASSFLMKQFAGRQIAKTSFMDASFMKNLESAMRFGMPLLVTDVESIDPILNPVLNREISRSGGRMLIRLGDQDIDFSPAFDLYLCTRDPACRFSPDLCSRVTLINFTVTPGGLQNQCLSAVLKAERPDVDQERCELLKLQGEYRARLTQLEKQLLQALGEDEGNFLDDDKIVSTLERIKTDSRDIQDKMQQQEAVRARVHEVTLLYQPLAQASSRIFFSLRALADLNPLYHFSVKTFLHLFTRVVTNKARLDAFSDQSDRLQVLTHDLFEASFCHACISLQDRHKLSLALHLAHLRLVSKGQGLDAQQLRFLLCGVSLGGTGGHRGGKDQLQSPACPTSSSQRPSTFPEGLLSERQAARASELCALPEFSDLPRQMAEAFSAWRLFLSAPLAEACIPLIGNGSAAEDELAAIWRRLLLLYALRPDRVAAGARAFVSHVLGSSFLGGHSDVDLAQVLECVPPSQNIFLLSSTAGFDTSGRVEALSQARGVAFSVIALGSPEGYETADKAIAAATAKGGWVLLKNVHLAFEWLHILDKRLHRMEPHKGFRLFMTTEMSASVPKGILSCAQVIVYEPPEGVKASLQQSFRGIIAERASGGPVERCRLHLMLSWLHALVLGRIRYCPIGWTKPYEFSETDLRNSADTIDAWVERAAGPGRANLAPEKLPWEAMRELIALCYGGRIDNDFDQRTLRSLLDRFFKSEVYGLEYALVQGARGHARASAGDDKQDTSALPILVPDGSSHSAFTQWIEALPESQVPGWLGLEADADRQLFMTRGRIMLEGWLHLHSALLAVDAIDEASEEEEEKKEEEEGGAEGRQGPPSASSLHVACMHTQGSMPAWSKQLMQSVERWLSSLPETVAVCKLGDAGGDDAVKLCVGREGALAQEILARVRADLQAAAACLTKTAAASNHARQLLAILRRGMLPREWLSHHKVPRRLTLEQWIADLALRLRRLEALSASCAARDEGLENAAALRVWLGSLCQPGAFLTAMRQASARARRLPLEELRLVVRVGGDARYEAAACAFVVEGAVLHGARWDASAHCLAPGAQSHSGCVLPALACRWCAAGEVEEEERGRRGVQDCKDARSVEMVEVPMYLNDERSTVICVLRLEAQGRGGEGGDESVAAMAPIAWHELGVAISAWSEP